MELISTDKFNMQLIGIDIISMDKMNRQMNEFIFKNYTMMTVNIYGVMIIVVIQVLQKQIT